MPSVAGGITCEAIVSAQLPPNLRLVTDNKLQTHVNQAMLALGRLDAINTLLPDVHLFLDGFVELH